MFARPATILTGLLTAFTASVHVAGTTECLAQPSAPPGEEQSVRQLLADPFVDPSFGYQLRPPVNCHIDAQKKLDENGAYSLVTFNHLELAWGLNVSVFRLEQARTTADLMAGLQRESLLAHQDQEVLDRRERTIAARAGGVLGLAYAEAGRPLIDLHAVVPFDREQVFHLRLRTRRHDQEVVRPLFEAVLDTFEFVHSELTHRQLDEALLRGAHLLGKGRQLAVQEKLVPETHVLLHIDDRPSGCARMTERAASRDGVAGVEIREQGWLFREDGGFHQIRNRFFLSQDFSSEVFETRLRIYVPAAEGQPAQLVEQLEQAVRGGDKLVLAYSQQTGDSALTNDALIVPASYLPKVAHRMLPRLLPLDRAELYAFASYSTAQRGLVLHTVRVEPLEVVPRTPEASIRYKLLDGEGIMPPYAEVFCDHAGRIVRLVSGNQTFTLSSREQIERLFGPRIRLAQEQLDRLLTQAR